MESKLKQINKNSKILRLLIILITSIIAVLCIRTFVFTLYINKGPSMLPTINDNELVFVNKLIYILREPNRNEIIVYDNIPIDYLKRVVAVGGDRIEVRDDQLFVNGEIIHEPYIADLKRDIPTLPSYTEDFGPLEVPDGFVFIMGDNRPISEDSRYFGAVPVEDIKGRVEFRIWPLPKLD